MRFGYKEEVWLLLEDVLVKIIPLEEIRTFLSKKNGNFVKFVENSKWSKKSEEISL